MLRLTCGPLAHWDVIPAENKRYGRVEVIETVIGRMEQGMRRWGVPVPPRDAAEEETELALVLDDAEFQSDLDGSSPDGWDGPPPSGPPRAGAGWGEVARGRDGAGAHPREDGTPVGLASDPVGDGAGRRPGKAPAGLAARLAHKAVPATESGSDQGSICRHETCWRRGRSGEE